MVSQCQSQGVCQLGCCVVVWWLFSRYRWCKTVLLLQSVVHEAINSHHHAIKYLPSQGMQMYWHLSYLWKNISRLIIDNKFWHDFIQNCIGYQWFQHDGRPNHETWYGQRHLTGIIYTSNIIVDANRRICYTACGKSYTMHWSNLINIFLS